MARVPMRDVVILVPGIMGSALEKNGKELWAVSGQAAWRALSTLGGSLESLALGEDDPDADELRDGVRATRVLPDVHLVPGLKKIDGYSAIAKMFRDRFQPAGNAASGTGTANYFEFAYDWRRDNAVAARLLKRLIDEKLSAWREQEGADARVILLAHSMGGLISRYYLEVLGGWVDCRALVTFGTPFHGSLDALEYLANGYQKLFLDLTEMVRSLTSMYQLLPTYPVVHRAGRWLRIDGCGDEIAHVNAGAVEAAVRFHRAIEKKVAEHLDDPRYLRFGYKTIPIVGVREGTLQSAILENDGLVSSRELPEGVDPILADGDGTVPRFSAIPPELSHEYRETFIAERHGSIQNHPEILEGLFERLKQMQVRGPVRGPEISVEAAERAAISLELEPVHHREEPVVIAATIRNGREGLLPLEAEVTPVDLAGAPVRVTLREDGAWHEARLEGLTPGLYRVEMRSRDWGPQAPPAVHELFEVLPL